MLKIHQTQKMKKSELLYELIKSLDKSEKRSFQIYLTKYYKASNAQVLFEAIGKLKDQEGKKKDDQLKALGIKNLAYEKHRLKTLLIEFLGDFYKKNSTYTQIHALLIQIAILMDKGQYNIVEELIDEGIGLAQKMEAANFLHEFKVQKIRLAKKLFNLSSQELYGLLEETTNHIQDVAKEFEYQKMQEKMYFWYLFSYTANPQEAVVETQKIIESELFEDESKAISLNEKKYLLRTQILHYRATGQLQKMIDAHRDLNTLYEKNKAYTQLYLSEYISNFFNTVGSYCLLEQYKEAKKILKKGEKIPEQFKDYFDNRITETYYSFSLISNLSLLLCEDKFKAAQAYLTEHENNFEYYFSKSPTFKSDYFSFAAVISFRLNDYKKVKMLCKRYEKEMGADKKLISSYWLIKIITVLSCYELEEKDKITSQINTYYYLQRKNKVSGEYYKVVMKLFRKLQQWPKPSELKLFCQKLLEGSDQEIWKRYKGADHLIYWLEKKANTNKSKKKERIDSK